MSRPTRILIIGANGQIGTELTEILIERHGVSQVISSDITPAGRVPHARYVQLNVLDAQQLGDLVRGEGVTQVYLLAAALSATGEKNPTWAWDLNMRGLLNVLELAREVKLDRVFWPSSIAAFGPSTPICNCGARTSRLRRSSALRFASPRAVRTLWTAPGWTAVSLRSNCLLSFGFRSPISYSI